MSIYAVFYLFFALPSEQCKPFVNRSSHSQTASPHPSRPTSLPMRLTLHHQHRMDMWSECVAKSHAFTLIQGHLHPFSSEVLVSSRSQPRDGSRHGQSSRMSIFTSSLRHKGLPFSLLTPSPLSFIFYSLPPSHLHHHAHQANYYLWLS
jgi:hypothetical protein